MLKRGLYLRWRNLHKALTLLGASVITDRNHVGLATFWSGSLIYNLVNRYDGCANFIALSQIIQTVSIDVLTLFFLLGRLLFLAHYWILFMTYMSMIMVVGVLDSASLLVRGLFDVRSYRDGLARNDLVAGVVTAFDKVFRLLGLNDVLWFGWDISHGFIDVHRELRLVLRLLHLWLIHCYSTSGIKFVLDNAIL